jgi:hypothetical protein
LGLFLISLLLFSVVPDNLKFFTGVFAFLFFSGILYCTFLFFKPYRSLSDEDLSFLFTDTIGQVRNTTGRAKHMLLKEFCASYDPAKSPHQGYPAYTAAQQGLQSPYSKQKLKMQANQPIDYMSADKRAELIGILMNENPEWSYAFAEKTANIMISNGYHF